MAARNHSLLCQEVDAELRELCAECKKKFPIIKEYTERALWKIRAHKEVADAQEAKGQPDDLPEFPLDEVLRAILMACETFQNKIVLLSLNCLRMLILRGVVKDETIAIVINLMKEQATNGDESVQLKVIQTVMATPPRMTLLNEAVVEQLMQLLFVLHNSASPSVHHTAEAGLTALAEKMAERAGAEVRNLEPPSAEDFALVRPAIRRSPQSMPMVQPAPAPARLPDPVKMFYSFVQDLCVMADYDASSLSSRYAVDAGERMRIGAREGYWLCNIKFPRPLCLDALGTCIAAHPAVFTGSTDCFALLRHTVCVTLLKNLKGCFDFAILIRSISLLQKLLRDQTLARMLMPELQVLLHIMLDLVNADRSPWQRATSLEFLKSVCEDPQALVILYEHGAPQPPGSAGAAQSGPRTFLDLTTSLSRLIHQVCFSSGIDSASLLQSATGGGSGGVATSSSASAGGLLGGNSGGGASGPRAVSNFGDLGRGLLLLGGVNLPQLLGGARDMLASGGPGSGGPGGAGARDIFVAGGGASGDGTGSGGGAAWSGGGQSRSSAFYSGPPPAAPRVKLLLLMSETEPPIVQPTFLVSLVIESVFAIVSSLYRLLLEAGDEPVLVGGGSGGAVGPSHEVTRRKEPLKGPLTVAQERCRGLTRECWASLLGALSLLLRDATDDACLNQALRCLQTLVYCCSRLDIAEGKEACLQHLAKYASPTPGHESEPEPARHSGGSVVAGLSTKNLLCFKAMLHFCHWFGGLLGASGWSVALRALIIVDRALQKAEQNQGLESMSLRTSLDALFETTALLSTEVVMDIVRAMAENMKSINELDEATVVLNRLVELCSYNLARLLLIWQSVLDLIMEICLSNERGELRGVAATALCKILGEALKKGALAMEEHQDAAQEQLLRHLEAFLRVPHEDVRARICEGLLGILHASGQELHPAAWSTTIRLVASAARIELERSGLEFVHPKAVDPARVDGSSEALRTTASMGMPALEGRDGSRVAPTVFQLLELLVQDFMEYVPASSVPNITASIGAFARYTGLGVNSSLTAVGFLWNVADALARYHCAPGGGAAAESGADVEELWVQIFLNLRVMAVDARPEVRNCAVKSLTSALLSHGRKVGVACYQRCLRDILIEVVAEIQAAADEARGRSAAAPVGSGLLVHHSRDTPEKQWNETMALGVEGVRRVLSNFAEEAGVQAFAPLAYRVLLQVQTTLHGLGSELAGSALRSLVDLMRIPASSQEFDAAVLEERSDALPIGMVTLGGGSSGPTSVWLLGWSVLWRMARFCMSRDVPESLMETFEKTLSSLRNTHRQLFTPTQHLVILQIALSLATSPSFYLPSSVPLKAAGGEESDGLVAGLSDLVSRYVEESGVGPRPLDIEVFDFVATSPTRLWDVAARTANSSGAKAYSKAAVATTSLVDANQSRNLDARSMESALREVCQEGASGEEAAQAFLGASRSPTHRTMLHISSARLEHVQGFVFGLLEDAQGFPDPRLEVLFLCQCCAMFLDVGRVVLDKNKVALAARTLCLLVLFCRRVLLQHLARVGRLEADPGDLAAEAEHLEAMLGQAVPHLCRVVSTLACGVGRPDVRTSGLWKLAVEALLYLIEDTLPAVERCTLRPDTLSAYWEAVAASLADAVRTALPSPERGPWPPTAAECLDANLLAQAVGNLVAYRLLASSATPQDVSETGVLLLKDLAKLQSDLAAAHVATAAAAPAVQGRVPGGSAGGVPAEGLQAEWTNLGHLFDLCARPEVEEQGCSPNASDEDWTLSVAALSGRLAAAAAAASAAPPAAPTPFLPRPPRVFAGRPELLGVAVPALLEHLRRLLNAHEDPRGASCGGRLQEVVFALGRLGAVRVDDAAAVVAVAECPRRARSACELAGSQALSMALLRSVSAMSTSSDPGVRRCVRFILEAISEELGL